MLENTKKNLDKLFFKFFFIGYCILILLSFFYNFFEYDESWIFQIINNYKRNITTTYSTSLAFGQFIYFELLSFISLSEDPQNFFSNRLISLLAITGNIYLIFKFVNQDSQKNSNQLLLILLFLYSFWFCFHEGGMSSRPDALFSFLLLFLVYSFLNFEKSFYLIYISTVLNLFFIFYHPIGFYVIAVNYYFFYCILNKKNFFILNGIILSVFLCLIFFTSIVQVFFENYNSFIERFAGKKITDLKDIFIIIYENISRDLMFKGRARHMLGYSKYSFVYFCILYLISIFSIFFFKKGNKNFKTFVFIFISLNIFYLILPNKWRHHLGVIVPILLMIFYYMQINFTNNFFSVNKTKTYKLINIFLMIIFLVKINYHVSNNYFLKNYINIFFKTDNLSYFSKLNYEKKKIDSLRYKLEKLTFTSNPVFKYIFNRSKYISNATTYDTDFFIMSNREYCTINKKKEKINYEYYESFVLYNQKYAVCIKKNILNL